MPVLWAVFSRRGEGAGEGVSGTVAGNVKERSYDGEKDRSDVDV